LVSVAILALTALKITNFTFVDKNKLQAGFT
jgi:hypothetical protein